MTLRHRAKHSIEKLARRAMVSVRGDPLVERSLALQGAIASAQIRKLDKVATLADVEFSVFSQWGEDGIIEWLVHCNGAMPEIFIEFGIQDYRESNTRFLLINRNWRGLVIDGSAENIDIVRQDQISWRHELHSIPAFITADNINDIIRQVRFPEEIGILSIDIDGNDYWVWRAIDCIRPQIVIAEYNALFGDRYPLSIPYNKDFGRTAAHHSNQYWGASIQAFELLGAELGYTMLGSNRAGSNAFFIRNDRLSNFEGRIADKTARPSRWRDVRDERGGLTLASGADRSAAIADLPLVDVTSGTVQSLRAFGDLYTASWMAVLDGRVRSATE